jgi:hypothetical protein
MTEELVKVDVGLVPVLDIERAKDQLKHLQELVKAYLVPSLDFGTQPGTDKPALFQPGAQKLCEIYGFNAKPVIISKTEDWDREPPLFDYCVETTLIRRSDNLVMGYGLGECNSYESKYKWRTAQRVCPDCAKPTIIKGKEEYGGGYLCFAKKGGCGAKFSDNDTSITEQPLGKVPNEDIASQKNTIMKMAKKRSLVDAVISATRSSGIFTQDLEDFLDAEVVTPTTPKPSLPSSPVATQVLSGKTSATILESTTEPDPTPEDWVRLKQIGIDNEWAEAHMKLWIENAKKFGKSNADIYQDALDKFGKKNELKEAKA